MAYLDSSTFHVDAHSTCRSKSSDKDLSEMCHMDLLFHITETLLETNWKTSMWNSDENPSWKSIIPTDFCRPPHGSIIDVRWGVSKKTEAATDWNGSSRWPQRVSTSLPVCWNRDGWMEKETKPAQIPNFREEFGEMLKNCHKIGSFFMWGFIHFSKIEKNAICLDNICIAFRLSNNNKDLLATTTTSCDKQNIKR